ncbi:polymorphic toxin-type HINT domain-containing protein [Streptomyces sp. NPDC048231]|uniref:polymorphic toxin-type HINT domain-containing protein n=1 Tax=Streptomyces sp. NPDC048231 TaxID=3365519 RepID=UPI00371973D2
MTSKEVKPGDKVAAADPTDGHFEGLRTVEARLVHRDSDRLDLNVQSASGKTAVIHTTDHHAFWDDTRHAWVIAAALLPGHVLSTPADGHATVVRKSNVDGAADMYNLTVNDLHTYYVLAGNTSVLVHNDGGFDWRRGSRTSRTTGTRAISMMTVTMLREEIKQKTRNSRMRCVKSNEASIVR